jgi:hypothetical protein
VLELRQGGFEPLEEYSGMVGLGEAWPEQFSRKVRDLRVAPSADGGQDAVIWMVKSPWPSMALGEALALVWSWVDRYPAPRSEAEIHSRAHEVLNWALGDVRTWLTQRRPAS